jgi:hypothetical protein
VGEKARRQAPVNPYIPLLRTSRNGSTPTKPDGCNATLPGTLSHRIAVQHHPALDICPSFLSIAPTGVTCRG